MKDVNGRDYEKHRIVGTSVHGQPTSAFYHHVSANHNQNRFKWYGVGLQWEIDNHTDLLYMCAFVKAITTQRR